MPVSRLEPRLPDGNSKIWISGFLPKPMWPRPRRPRWMRSAWALAASANHAFRRTLEGKRIPAELWESIEKLKAAYRPHEHELLGAERFHARMVDELGLKDYLAERFAIAGTPQDCIEQVERAAEAGVKKIFLGPLTGDPAQVLQTFAQEIMPRFQ